MALIPYAGFVGSAYSPQSPKFDCQELINWYLEQAESQFAKSQNCLLPCPGFTTFTTLPKSPVRGLFAENDRTFAVGGDSLYELARNGGVTEHPITTLTAPGAPTITNSPLDPAIDAPGQPLITQGGALGTTAYGYKVTATNAHGETEASAEGSTAVGNATLSVTSFNVVTWAAVDGASGYKVYRTTGPGAGKLIGVVAAPTLFLIDSGTSGTTATVPSSNTTAGTAGTTTYGYKVVARLGLGHTAASAEGLTNTGQATLDSDNYNIVTWAAVPSASSYDVYRTTGGAITPPILIGNTADTTFNDTGQDGDAETPPTSDTTSTFSLTNDGQPVSICSSGDAGGQLLIVSGGGAYVFDLTANTFGKVVDGATAGAYIGGYFVVLDAATSTLKGSELLNGFTFDAAQVYQREAAGDRWLAMGATENELWLVGSASTDVWRPTGDNETRFAPYQDVNIDQGVIAPASLVVNDGQFMWIAQNQQGAGAVLISQGYDTQRISTHQIERQLESFSTLADAIGWCYMQEGHTFYVLNFPSDGVTWVWDKLTGQWHKRGYWDPDNMAYTAYRAQCHTFAFGGVGFGQHLVGDSQTGVVASMSTDVMTDIDGSLIRCLRRAPHLCDRLLNLTVWSVIFDFEVGLGLSTGQGSDPTAMVRASKNSAKTWGNERWASIGPQGDYDLRVKLNRWGNGRDWVFELVVTDPVPRRLAAAYIDTDEAAA